MQAFWIVLSTFMTVASYALIKGLPEHWAFYEIFFFRMLLMAAAAFAAARLTGIALKSAHPGLHVRRTAAGIAALSLNIIAVRNLPLAVADVLVCTSPLFVAAWTCMAASRRGDPVDKASLAAVAAGFAGVVLVMNPNTEGVSPVHAATALVSSLFVATVFMCLKRLGRAREPVVRTVFWFASGGAVAAFMPAALFGSHGVLDYVLEPGLWAIGLCTVAGQLALTRGWGKGSTMLCAALQFSSVLFAVLIGIVLFDERPTLPLMIGMAVIVLAQTLAAAATMRRDGSATMKRNASAS